MAPLECLLLKFHYPPSEVLHVRTSVVRVVNLQGLIPGSLLLLSRTGVPSPAWNCVWFATPLVVWRSVHMDSMLVRGISSSRILYRAVWCLNFDSSNWVGLQRKSAFCMFVQCLVPFLNIFHFLQSFWVYHVYSLGDLFYSSSWLFACPPSCMSISAWGWLPPVSLNMFTGTVRRDKPCTATDSHTNTKTLSKETPKETIRFKKRGEAGEATSSSVHQEIPSSGPPGLNQPPKTKSLLCFPEITKVVCPVGAQCQYCHDYCCRSTADHVSHRCSQHVNWWCHQPFYSSADTLCPQISWTSG